MENQIQTHDNGEHDAHIHHHISRALIERPGPREGTLERWASHVLLDMALRDFAAQFVSNVLRDVTIREQQVVSTKPEPREVQQVVPPLLTNLGYRDVAAQFVNDVLREISICEQQVGTTKIDSPLALAPVSETETCLSDVSIDEGANEQGQPTSANEAETQRVSESTDGTNHHPSAMHRSIMMQMIQNFAFEVIASALEKIVIAVGFESKREVAAGSKNTAVQRATEEKEAVAAPLLELQQKRPVSRRQLIHKIAKATNDHVLSVVLQSVTTALQAKPQQPSPVVFASVVQAPTISINSDECEQDEEARISPPSTPEVHSSSPPATRITVDTNQLPPPLPAISADDGSIRSQVASAFVHKLLLQATVDSEPHAKPRISVQPPPPADQETSSSGAHSRRKSPNVHKRNLVKKDSAPLSSATQPSPPPPEKPSPDDNPGILTPDPAKPKRTDKRDPRPKHHPHKTHEKAASGDDSFTVKATSPPATKFKLTLPLENNLSLFSAISSSPLSSTRLAQEIYRPRNAIETSGPSPLVLKKPTARAHPRRHPHHIQNAAVAKETSYSRDSPRADAIASELQRKAKSPSSDATIASHTLLPLTGNAPTIPAQQPPAQSPTASSKKQSSRDKNASRSPVKMRSGFCQQCVSEGRSCKINDCLKHQLLK